MEVKKTIALIYILCASCKNSQKQNNSDPTWTTHKLPNGWTISTPAKFKVDTLTGIDSQPGYISSSEDSILLNYDSGTDVFPKNSDCDFSQEVQDAKFRMMNQEENFSGGVKTLYNLRLDTINEKIAIIKTPKVKENGLMAISIHDCHSGAWIGISGKGFDSEKEKLVLKIFETIKLEE